MSNSPTAQATFKELLYLCNKARGLANPHSPDGKPSTNFADYEIALLRQAVNTLADAVQLLAVQLTQGD
jgi:hypothetical protein